MLFILQQSQAKHKKIHTHAQFIVKYTIAHTHTDTSTHILTHTDTRTHFHTYSYKVTYVHIEYGCQMLLIDMHVNMYVVYVCICARIYKMCPTHSHTHTSYTCTFACLPICWGNKCKCLSVNQTGHYWLLVRAKHYRRALRMRVCTHTNTLIHSSKHKYSHNAHSHMSISALQPKMVDGLTLANL